MFRRLLIIVSGCFVINYGHADGIKWLGGLEYKAELQASLSDGHTPLWLNANKHGLSSVSSSNGYFRAALERPLAVDSARRWGIGYGIDMAAAYNYSSSFIVQQAFAELRWLGGVLTIGSREWPMELKNNSLSSGSQTLGINARPVPQVRIALPEYWTIPFTGGWVGVKGHVAYGKMTDDGWQHDFTSRQSKYADDVLYHSKAGYLRIGNKRKGFPLTVEMGLEMATLFGGTMYRPDGKGGMETYHGGTGIKAFWEAFVPGGSEANEDTYKNVAGDMLGSWVMRISYDRDDWRIGLYADHFFEDHSQMFFLDYNGYGQGENWNVKEDKKYFLYYLKDIMLGAELNLKHGTFLRDVVFEYLYTKYQSGPVYHDRTPSMSEHIGGLDDYYNHSLYPGWQHWGQVMGNPLYMSPLYNGDGTVGVKDNRFTAFHVGIGGRPMPNLGYRILATWQEGFGTYRDPYTEPRHNTSILVEATYDFTGKALNGFGLTCGYGMDFGSILGNNYGFQLTVRKTGVLGL